MFDAISSGMSISNCKVRFLLSALLFLSPGAKAKELKGLVSVIGPTELRFEEPGVTVQLYGVSACASRQRAFYNGIPWPCGAVSTGWLTQQTLGYAITCFTEGSAGYARYFARCYLPGDGGDLAKNMLLLGMAVLGQSDGKPTYPEYRPFELTAKRQMKGLWSSSFEIDGRFYGAPGK